MTSLVSPACAQAPLKGSMNLVCASLDVLDLHFKMPSNNETLVAHIFMVALRTDGVKNVPHKSRSQWCTAKNQCENVETTIIFKKFNLEKEASGTYVVEFSDGHRQQGTFKTVRTPQPKPFLCE
ncbi:MAG: hypothetical protein WCG81_04320 [Candidatus Angelobacter sp.]